MSKLSDTRPKLGAGPKRQRLRETNMLANDGQIRLQSVSGTDQDRRRGFEGVSGARLRRLETALQTRSPRGKGVLGAPRMECGLPISLQNVRGEIPSSQDDHR